MKKHVLSIAGTGNNKIGLVVLAWWLTWTLLNSCCVPPVAENKRTEIEIGFVYFSAPPPPPKKTLFCLSRFCFSDFSVALIRCLMKRQAYLYRLLFSVILQRKSTKKVLLSLCSWHKLHSSKLRIDKILTLEIARFLCLVQMIKPHICII